MLGDKGSSYTKHTLASCPLHPVARVAELVQTGETATCTITDNYGFKLQRAALVSAVAVCIHAGGLPCCSYPNAWLWLPEGRVIPNCSQNLRFSFWSRLHKCRTSAAPLTRVDLPGLRRKVSKIWLTGQVEPRALEPAQLVCRSIQSQSFQKQSMMLRSHM